MKPELVWIASSLVTKDLINFATSDADQTRSARITGIRLYLYLFAILSLSSLCSYYYQAQCVKIGAVFPLLLPMVFLFSALTWMSSKVLRAASG